MEKKTPGQASVETSEAPSNVLVNVIIYTIVTVGVGALTMFLIR